MNIRLEFAHDGVHLALRDIFEPTDHMNASGPVVGWQEVLNAMQDNGIGGM